MEGRLPLELSREAGRPRKQRLEPRAQVMTVEDGQWPCFQPRWLQPEAQLLLVMKLLVWKREERPSGWSTDVRIGTRDYNLTLGINYWSESLCPR